MILVGISRALLVLRVNVIDCPADTSALSGCLSVLFLRCVVVDLCVGFSVFLGGLMLMFLVSSADGPLHCSASLIGLVPRHLQFLWLFSLVLYGITSAAFLLVLGGVFVPASVAGSGDGVDPQVFYLLPVDWYFRSAVSPGSFCAWLIRLFPACSSFFLLVVSALPSCHFFV